MLEIIQSVSETSMAKRAIMSGIHSQAEQPQAAGRSGVLVPATVWNEPWEVF